MSYIYYIDLFTIIDNNEMKIYTKKREVNFTKNYIINKMLNKMKNTNYLISDTTKLDTELNNLFIQLYSCISDKIININIFKRILEILCIFERTGFIYKSIEMKLILFRIIFCIRIKENANEIIESFYFYIVKLYKYYPSTILELIRLLPIKYGNWKDIINIIYLLDFENNKEHLSAYTKEQYFMGIKTLMDYLCKTIINDEGSNSPSLLAKVWPKEKSKYKNIYRRLALMLQKNQKEFNIFNKVVNKRNIYANARKRIMLIKNKINENSSINYKYKSIKYKYIQENCDLYKLINNIFFKDIITIVLEKKEGIFKYIDSINYE